MSLALLDYRQALLRRISELESVREHDNEALEALQALLHP